MTNATTRLCSLLPAAALSMVIANAPLSAQGLADPEAVDKIIGSEVVEEEAEAAADPERVISAIEKVGETAVAIRKISKLDQVDVVYLVDSAQTEGGPPSMIEAKIKENAAAIEEMRKELEGNAMLFHAIDSRQVLVRDVIAVEIEDQVRAVIYAAAKPAQPSVSP